MAVPDRLIGKILKTFVKEPVRAPRSLCLTRRPRTTASCRSADITCFVTHPCHPPIFNDETDPNARTNYFGRVHAKQHIVCALMQGRSRITPNAGRLLARFISR
jgi:D-apionate oxidoisomerase